MIKFEEITKLAQGFSCQIVLTFGPDGALLIKAYGPNGSDFVIIGGDWNDKTIYDCIKDVCTRV